MQYDCGLRDRKSAASSIIKNDVWNKSLEKGESVIRLALEPRRVARAKEALLTHVHFSCCSLSILTLLWYYFFGKESQRYLCSCKFPFALKKLKNWKIVNAKASSFNFSLKRAKLQRFLWMKSQATKLLSSLKYAKSGWSLFWSKSSSWNWREGEKPCACYCHCWWRLYFQGHRHTGRTKGFFLRRERKEKISDRKIDPA